MNRMFSHDEIMLWLDANVHSLIKPEWMPKAAWSATEVKSWRAVMGDAEIMPAYPKQIVVAGKHWEDNCGHRDRPLYIDLAVDLQVYYMLEDDHPPALMAGVMRRALNFEVKPRIDSLGDLIRQLRRYQAEGRERLVVVSGDGRYERILLEQGFYFVLAPGPQREFEL